MRHITLSPLILAFLLGGCSQDAGRQPDDKNNETASQDSDNQQDSTETDEGSDEDPDSMSSSLPLDEDETATGSSPEFDPESDEKDFTCPTTKCISPCRFYVSESAYNDYGSGERWADAFSSIQRGINEAHCAAQECGAPCQVWVEAGSYSAFRTSPEDTVRLRSHVELYGGFSGTEISLEERDSVANETVLTGEQLARIVVTGSDDAVLDGFVVTQGGGDEGYGTGMEIGDGSPIIRNCQFIDNHGLDGGAMMIYGGTPRVENSRFLNNTGPYAPTGGVGGGAILVSDGSAIIVNSVFEGNHTSAHRDGGAIRIMGDLTDVRIENCHFESNHSVVQGGAIHIGDDSRVTIVNSIFYRNVADFTGGAISLCCYNHSYMVKIINCTFFRNAAEVEGGAISHRRLDDIEVVNSIFREDSPDEIKEAWGGSIDFSVLPGGYSYHYSSYLIDADPLFVDADAGDFHLLPGSPCIDAGNGEIAPSFDFDSNPRIDDPATPNTLYSDPNYIDVGAFEYQASEG